MNEVEDVSPNDGDNNVDDAVDGAKGFSTSAI